MSTAVQLKEEGNTLFVAKKYTDALDDAKKSTELDSSCTKGWGRLATALQATGDLSSSILNWQVAILTLPKENLTAADLRLKGQYEAGLKSARAALDYEGPVLMMQERGKERMPWDLANEMMPELLLAGQARMTSSAWVIAWAHKSWKEGVEAMYSLKHVRTPEGIRYGGIPGKAIDGLSDAVMRDERVFVIESQDFIESYDRMEEFEALSVGAWGDADAERVIREMQERQRTKGWDDVRPALSTTIRGWAMHAFMISGTEGSFAEAERILAKAIEVLQGGRRVWKDVDPDTRGTIFSDTFVRGIRLMHFQQYMKAYVKNQSLENKTHPLEGLLKAANDILREIGPPERPALTVDPGFVSSFVIYPRARALSLKGLYFEELAQRGRAKSLTDLWKSSMSNLRKAAKFYLQSADAYPEDDEEHVWALHEALLCMFRSGAILRETLPLLERMRLATPKMKRIWEVSALQHTGRDKTIQKMTLFEEGVRKLIREGRLTEDVHLTPDQGWMGQ